MRVPWWLWSLFTFLALVYGVAWGITAAVGGSKSHLDTITWAVGLPVWLALAILVRMGQRRQGAHSR
jgi:hypothetical protein